MKEGSEFPWTYEAEETGYFLEGDGVVTQDAGQPVQMEKSNLSNISCRDVLHLENRQRR